MYTIEITYQTGDYFGSHEETDIVGYSWDSLDDAKESLKRIKEHYSYYQAKNSRYREKVDKPNYYKDDYSVVIVGNSKDKVESISAFWCGYFETLYEAKIIEEEDNDMSFSFR
ncbi:MAG: hypothetical protein WC055_00860 [Melioribacteraceae bacterium]